ncbi:extracellular solute-binding protein [Micromonospora sp. WMMD882]|uniref:extracellular solute-binding protein n=1 Tax=Micromonospora sp. WMMD882 TaxID=3015151 RepID=UPI00248B64B9|nr:extracellular solute-binding protein [Micromonospora sp. WMMD882]WBB80325.1 extracellular solute-binding protein [Micromonospora sp. WMMD882]
MKAHRFLVATTAAAMAVALAACGTSGPGDSGDGDQTLNLWYLSDNPTVPDAAKRFEAANPGWKVNLTDTPNDQYKTKLRVGLGTPNGPDVFFNWGGSDLVEYEKSDLVVPLEDMMREKKLNDVFGPAVLRQGQVDGTQYGLATAVEASMVWYNKDIFAELNLSAPTTWEQFLDVIAKTKAAGYTPIAMANSSQWPGSQWWSELVALSCGPDFWATLGTEPKIRLDDPCVVAGHQKIVELVQAGAFNQGFNGLDYDKGESRQLFWSGKAAMNHMGNWTLTSAKEEAPEMMSKMDFFTVPAWSGAKGTSDMMTGGLAPMYSAAKSDKSDKAADLLYYLVDQDSAKAITELGRVPVYEGTEISEPLVKKVSDAIAAAPALAPWPDHVLAPEWTTEMLQTVQSLFGLSVSPQDAASRLQTKYEQVKQ